MGSQFKQCVVELPDGKYDASFRFTSSKGFSGCEGFVRPGILKINGTERLVQTKRYYESSYDDRGMSFSQDPVKKTNESYQIMCSLKSLGFKVLPFFGKMVFGKNHYLVLYDLREGETIEVYDEKWFHQNKPVLNVIDGKEVRSKEATGVVLGMENYSDIALEFLRTSLLKGAHYIDLGLGTCHMITRDPKTNKGDIFLVDVGEYYQPKSDCREAAAESLDDLLTVPEDEIRAVYAKLMQIHHPEENAAKLYEEFCEKEPRKKEFMDLLYKSAVGVSLWNWIGGWMDNGDWARKRFVKNEFSDHFMRIKLHFLWDTESFERHAKQALYFVNQEGHDRFVSSKAGSPDLFIGVDFAQLAVLDSRVIYLMMLRDMVKNNEDNENGVPNDFPPVLFGNDGFPNMAFFDAYNESKGNTHVTEITCRRLFDEETKYELSVEFDWDTAYHIAAAGPFASAPPFTPNQIKGIKKNGVPVEDFDLGKIKIRREHGIWFHYLYEDEPVHTLCLKDDADISLIQEFLVEQKKPKRKLAGQQKLPFPH